MPNQIYYDQPIVSITNKLLFFVNQGEKTQCFSNYLPYFVSQNQLKGASLKAII